MGLMRDIARAVGTNEADDLALLDFEVHIPDRHQATGGLAEAFDVQICHLLCSFAR